MDKIQFRAQEKFVEMMDDIVRSELRLIDKFSIINCILIDILESLTKILDEVELKGAVNPRSNWIEAVNKHLKPYGVEINDTRVYH